MRCGVFLAVAVLVAPALQADIIDLYLFAGQSNMVGQNAESALPDGWNQPDPSVRHTFWIDGTPDPDGWGPLAPQAAAGPGFGSWGPDLVFGRLMGQRAPGSTAVLKTAVNGSSLALNWRPSRDDIYPDALGFLRDSISSLEAEGHDVRVRGFFWEQGYTDSASLAWSSQYASNMAELMAALRSDLGEPDLPVIFTRLHAGTLRNGRPIVGLETMRANQTAFAASDPHAYLIDIDDIGFRDAGVHYDGAGLAEIGRRMFGMYTTQVIPAPASALVLLGLCVPLRRRR